MAKSWYRQQRINAMFRDRRGLLVERRIKAVFWWCYTQAFIGAAFRQRDNISEADRQEHHGDLQEEVHEYGA